MTGASPLPILLSEGEGVPIYLQITSQIKHLIISRRLAEGARLPPVRELAAQLGVNVGTVAQAYRELRREGLVDGQTGRGTHVRPFSAAPGLDEERRDLLVEEIERTLTRARALGFSDAETRGLFDLTLARRERRMRVVFVGPTQLAADVYAARLRAAFVGAPIEFEPFSLARLEDRDPAVNAALDVAYYVLALALWVPQVKATLEHHRVRAAVIGLTAELTADTVARLRAVPAGEGVLVVTEERNVNAVLSVVQQHTGLDPRAADVVTEMRADELPERAGRARHVVFSLGVRPLVNLANVPPDKRLELEFEISAESIFRLREVLQPGSLALND